MDSIEPIIFDKSVKGRLGVKLPKLDVPSVELSDHIDSSLLRNKSADLPEVTEPQVVRHFVNLSTKNHHVDKNLYPLGSCTMKYNPKINDAIASLSGFSGLHPDQSENSVQGALELMYELEQMLKKITGMARVTLQPSAGSQGEFVGILMIKKYHQLNGDNNKKYIIIPETAHGTNPASVVLGGFKTRKVKSDDRGRVDIDHLKSIVDFDTAGMMLTQPNTLGLFEDKIEEISSIIHGVGGLMYMDGANLNALVGLARSADMGFDITHINLHKTFSTPHGGGGPGAGPIGVVDKLVPFLPIPMIDKKDDFFKLNFGVKHTIGQIHSFFGNFGILVRAYIYISTLGDNGLKKMTKMAILNANYLKYKLMGKFNIPFPEGTLHEFVASCIDQKERGSKVLDIAKSLLDYGYHAPTIYFPTNIPESMMIEPTESETKETLDAFADTLLDLDSKINTNINFLKDAPVKTPVSRLDETKANREPNLRWKR